MGVEIKFDFPQYIAVSGPPASAVLSTDSASTSSPIVVSGPPASATLGTDSASASSEALTYAELILTTGDHEEEYEVAEGGTYTYNNGILHQGWIRKEAFDIRKGLNLDIEPENNNIYQLAQIDGDSLPSAESPAWTHSVVNGNITTDGTSVNIETTTAGGVGLAAPILTAGSLGSPPFGDTYTNNFSKGLVQFSVKINSVTGSDSRVRAFFALNSSAAGKVITLNLAYNDNNLRLVDASNVPIGSANGDFDLVGEEGFVFIEILYDNGGTCYVWVDNQATPLLSVPFSSLADDGGDNVIIGNYDATLGNNANMDVKDLKIYYLAIS